MSANLFFASDHHLSHPLMVGLRGFKTPEEMNETMIERHNKVVRPQDHVYFLGDVAMKPGFLSIVRKFNGHKRLIFGNHDIFEYKEYARAGFKKMMAYRVLDGLIFSHIPIYRSEHIRFRCNVHGHLHTNKIMVKSETISYPDPRYLCVSVEQIDYTPISLEQIKQKLK